MKIIKQVQQGEVWYHWRSVEGFTDDNFRSDIRDPLPDDLIWYLSYLELPDIHKVYIISSDDWRTDKLCVSDFKLITAISNYQLSSINIGKYGDIKQKEVTLKNSLDNIDTKLIFVAANKEGPYTIIEGNRRAIALGSIGKLKMLEIYLGISSRINNYLWARYSK